MPDQKSLRPVEYEPLSPHELITKLISYQGPCLRFCVYCPEILETRRVKECVEGMIKEIYEQAQQIDNLLEENAKIKRAYKEVTGNAYTDS